MTNLINPSVIAADALEQLEYSLVAGSLVYQDRTSDFGLSNGHKVGDTINIRTSTDVVTNEFTPGVPVVAQEINQSKTPLTIEKHFDVPIKVEAKQRALNLDGLRAEVINPAMISLAQKIDTYLLTKIVESQGLYTAPVANLFTSSANIAQANKFANRQQIDKANRIALVNDDLEATLLGIDAFTKFDHRGQLGVDALTRASLGTLLQSAWFSSNNFPEASQATGDGTTTLDNALPTSNVQGQKTLVVDSTAGTFNAGDKISIAGAKRAYTVSAEVLATAIAIPINEEINENLSELDASAVAVIEPGETIDYQGVFFNPGAFGFATPALDPVDSERSAVVSANGFSIRFVETWNDSIKQTMWSFDVLIGAAAVDPRRSMLIGSF